MAQDVPRSAVGEARATRILVVDDDPRVREMLSRYLSEEGFEVGLAPDGAGLWQNLEAGRPDLVILDLVLPGQDGLTLARELRTRMPELPIIMLTGRGDVVDRVVGLEVGADDYIAKPFHLREVLARIKTVLRRYSRPAGAAGAPEGEADLVQFEGWKLDLRRRRLTAPDGGDVALTTGELDLLAAFVSHPNRVMDRDRLMDLAKGRSWSGFDRSIDTQVARLRKKIEADPRNPAFIKSVRGVGYVFAAEVRRGRGGSEA